MQGSIIVPDTPKKPELTANELEVLGRLAMKGTGLHVKVKKKSSTEIRYMRALLRSDNARPVPFSMNLFFRFKWLGYIEKVWPQNMYDPYWMISSEGRSLLST